MSSAADSWIWLLPSLLSIIVIIIINNFVIVSADKVQCKLGLIHVFKQLSGYKFPRVGRNIENTVIPAESEFVRVDYQLVTFVLPFVYVTSCGVVVTNIQNAVDLWPEPGKQLR